MTSENRSSSPIEARELVLIWALLLVAKLLLSLALPVVADETYYWVWAQRPQLSYFDHSGFIAWLLALNPADARFFRWPAVLFAHAGWGILLFFLRTRLSRASLLFFLTALCAHPLTGLGSLVVTPDLPLAFFWTTSFVVLWSWVERPSSVKILLLGLLLGLGFCSKYHIVLWVLSLIPLFFWREFRRLWTPKAFFFVTSIGLVACGPVLFWNIENDWISFLFQMNRGLARPDWKVTWTLEYMAASVILLGLWRNPFTRSFWPAVPLLLLTWGPFLFFLFTSFGGPIEINWISMSVPAALLTGAIAHDQAARVHLIMMSIVSLLLVLASLLPNGKVAALERLQELKSRRADLPLLEKRGPLYATTYQLASQYWFLLQRPVWKIAGASRFDQFDLWPESRAPNSFYLLNVTGQALPESLAPAHFQKNKIESLPSGLDLWEIRGP